MSDLGDFFGDVSDIAAVTSEAAGVVSGVINDVANITGNNSLRELAYAAGDVAQFADGVAYTAGSVANGIDMLSNINGNLFDPSNTRLALAGLNQLYNAAQMGSELMDQFNGSDYNDTSVTFKQGNGTLIGSGIVRNGSSGVTGGGSSYGGGGGSSYGGGGGGSGGSHSQSVSWAVSVTCPGLGAKVVFPITPQITITDTAKYSSAGLVHSNYAMQFYESSEVSAVQIQADFPVQNAVDGQKLLSCIYMFRAATKMFWGGGDPAAGTPPPLVFLNGYGRGYLSNVPCVVTNFTHTMPEGVDYIPSGGAHVPTNSQMGITLQPVYSRNSLNSLSIAAVAAGSMLNFI